MHVSERRACAALGQHRSTQRKVPRGREDEERLTADTIALARQYGRYGYRKIAGLLEQAGWLVNDKRVERIWRRVSRAVCTAMAGIQRPVVSTTRLSSTLRSAARRAR